MSRRSLAAALAVAAAALALPAAAGAHATLEGTSPPQGATVKTEPKQIVFRFDEAVEGNFGAVRVFDATGKRVDQGDAFHPGGAGSQLGVHLRPGLAKGTYTATYRVVSADGHIVSSGAVFSVGHPGAAPSQTVAELVGRSQAGAVTRYAFVAARAVQYAALATAAGALAFLLLVWLPALGVTAGSSDDWRRASEAFVRRLRTLLLAATLAGALSALAAVDLEAAEAGGVSGWTALQPHILKDVLGTRFGTVWTVAAGCWLAVGGLGLVLSSPRRAAAPVLRSVPLGATGLAAAGGGRIVPGALLAPLGFLVLVPALSGHGVTQHPVAVLLPANVLHVVSMSLWLGGLIALLAAVPAATRQLTGGDRTRLLAGVLVRFSVIALACVSVLLVTGLVQSYVEIRHLDLVLHTAFGRAALVKLCLLGLLIGLGALNRQRTVPALRAAAAQGASPGAPGVTLRRTLRGEVALIAAVLAVTGALASYPPAIAAVTGPVSRTTRIGPQELQLTLDPARVGSNQLHLYLTDPKTGVQESNAKELDVAATLPSKGISAAPVKGQLSGPGHFTVSGLVLGVPGTWTLKITDRVSDFNEYVASVKVPVR